MYGPVPRPLVGAYQGVEDEGGAGTTLLVVTLSLKRLCKRRRIVLSFCTRPFARNVKEACMLYLDAATGGFHGLHVAPGQRGRGLARGRLAGYI